MKISFVLTGEGSSDLRLVEHIESVLIEEGFSEVSGESPDLTLLKEKVGCSVAEKLDIIFKRYPTVDIVFVHRDGDGVGAEAREEEIRRAVAGKAHTAAIIPVIPVTMLETWLLADEEAIKRVAGNKAYRGRMAHVQNINALERLRDPKALLMEVLCEVSGTSGARLTKFKKRFSEMRARLTFDLDPEGPVNRLSSYVEFRDRVRNFSREKLNV